MKSSLLLFLLVPLILVGILLPTSATAVQIVDSESSDALASETTSTTFTDLALTTQLIHEYDASNTASSAAYFDVIDMSCTFDILYSKMTTTAPTCAMVSEVEATARAGVSNTGMCIASGIDEVSGHYMMDIAPATNHRYDDLGAGGGIVAVARNGCNDDLFAGSIWEFHDTIFDVNADVSSSGHAKTAMNLRI